MDVAPSNPDAPPLPPRSWPLLGILPAMRRAPHRALAGLQATRGDHATAWLGPRRVLLLSDPEVCRALLRASEDEQKKSVFYDKLRQAFGDGLLTGRGAVWRRSRALIQPLLTPRAVAAYVPVMVATTERLIASWEREAAADRPVDAAAAAAFVAREVTVRALFGDDGAADDGAIAEALATMEAWLARRFWSLLDPEWFPTPARRRHRAAVAVVDRLVYDLIARRRAGMAASDDLLGRLVRARDADGALSERQLRHEVTTLYLAGQQTTAQAIAFTLWSLARHPAAQARVRAEAAEVVGAGAPTADHVRQLVWTRACVDESLRLYPPVWSLGRETLCPIDAAGTRIPPGRTCIVSPWVLHRRGDLWPDPAAFRPERFLDTPAPRAFLPFGAGHRNCVGRDLALVELVLVIAMLVRRFCFTDATPVAVTPRALVSLEPHPAPQLRLEPVSGGGTGY